MRHLMIIAAVALACGAAHARDLTNLRLAQANPPETAPQAAPAAQAAPDAATPGAQPTKQAKKKQAAKRPQSDEEKARSIAAKYGISW